MATETTTTVELIDELTEGKAFYRVRVLK
jgi:hypothetical protein